VLLGVSALGTLSVATNPRITGMDWGVDPGPGLVPGLLLALLALGALGLVLRGGVGLGRSRGQPGAGVAPAALRPYLLPAAMVLLLIVYNQAMSALGFVRATALFACLCSILIAWQEGRRRDPAGLLLFVAEGLAITAFMYVVFERVIGVPLP